MCITDKDQAMTIRLKRDQPLEHHVYYLQIMSVYKVGKR